MLNMSYPADLTLQKSEISTTELLIGNSNDLVEEMRWLRTLIEARIKFYFDGTSVSDIFDELPAPVLNKSNSPYAQFLQQHDLSQDERLVLLLALAPHICPWVLDPFLIKNQNSQRGFTEFGGLKGVYHSGFLPTGETAAFLVAAENLTRRFIVQNLLSGDHFFARKNILRLEKDKTDEPFLSGALVISKEFLNYFTSGKPYRPAFSSEFPAQLLHTNLAWEDLVLEDEILDDLEEILAWLQHGEAIMEDMGLKKHLKPGFRSLFYGPPGTGKTLAVSLLGKITHREVYRIDISKVVSKYIGETEKNLANIFDQAEYKNWILFFDEADAIFGKRTATKDAKDRYANQEIAYLLQRIEEYSGLVILATNLKANIDEAFARRFQSIVFFPIPSPQLRLELWQKAFSQLELDGSVNLPKLAQEYEVTGGAIINILRYCAIKSVGRMNRKIKQSDIITGLRREFRKEGKTI